MCQSDGHNFYMENLQASHIFDGNISTVFYVCFKQYDTLVFFVNMIFFLLLDLW